MSLPIRAYPPKISSTEWNNLVHHGIILNGSSYPGSPVAGQIFYRTDLKCLYYYNGSSWEQISSAGTGGSGVFSNLEVDTLAVNDLLTVENMSIFKDTGCYIEDGEPVNLKPPSGHYTYLFATVISPLDHSTIMTDPVLSTTQAFFVEKDVSSFGFFGTASDPYKGYGGGAILMGQGFTGYYCPPLISLTDSGQYNSGESLPENGTEGECFYHTPSKSLYYYYEGNWIEKYYGLQSPNYDTLFLIRGNDMNPANIFLNNLQASGLYATSATGPLSSYSPFQLEKEAIFKDTGLTIQIDGSNHWVEQKPGWTPTGDYLKLFCTTVHHGDRTTTLTDPILTCNQGFFVEKDVSSFGFLGTASDPQKEYGGGAILMGQGLTGRYCPPLFDLTGTMSGMEASIGGYNSGESLPVSGINFGDWFYNTSNKSLYYYEDGWHEKYTDVLSADYDTLFLVRADYMTPANLYLGRLTAMTGINLGKFNMAGNIVNDVPLVEFSGLPTMFDESATFGNSISVTGDVALTNKLWIGNKNACLAAGYDSGPGYEYNYIYPFYNNIGLGTDSEPFKWGDFYDLFSQNSFSLGTGSDIISLTVSSAEGTRFFIPDGEDKTVGLGSEGHAFAYIDVDRVYANEFRKLSDGSLWNLGLWQAGEVIGVTLPLKITDKYLLLDQSLLSLTSSQISDWATTDLVVSSVKANDSSGSLKGGNQFTVSWSLDESYLYLVSHSRHLRLSTLPGKIVDVEQGLNVGTTFTVAGQAGVSGQVLTSQGSGSPVWVTPTPLNPFNQNLNTSNDAIFNSVKVISADGDPSHGATFKVSGIVSGVPKDFLSLNYDVNYSYIAAHFTALHLSGDNGIIFGSDIDFNNKTFSNYLGSLGSGSPSSSTFLRGDGVWSNVPVSNPFDQTLNKANDVIFNSVQVKSVTGVASEGGAFKINDGTSDVAALTYNATYSTLSAHDRILRLSSSTGLFIDGNIDFNNKVFTNYLSSLGSGSPTSSTYLRGDGTWATPSTGNPFNQNLNTTNDAMFNSVKVISASGDPAYGAMVKVGTLSDDYLVLSYDTWYATVSAHSRILKLSSVAGLRIEANIDFMNKTFSNHLTGLGTGTPSASTFLRGDGTWSTISTGNPFNQNLNTSNDAIFNSVKVVPNLGDPSIGAMVKISNGTTDFLVLGYDTWDAVISSHYKPLSISSVYGLKINANIDFMNKSFSNHLTGLGTGTPSSSTFLRGDGTWATPSAAGNPFDQTLNKANNVQFANLSLTGTLGTLLGTSLHVQNNGFAIGGSSGTTIYYDTSNSVLKISQTGGNGKNSLSIDGYLNVGNGLAVTGNAAFSPPSWNSSSDISYVYLGDTSNGINCQWGGPITIFAYHDITLFPGQNKNVIINGGRHVIPESTNAGQVGNSSKYFYASYANYVYGKNPGTFDSYDDLALVKQWGEETPVVPDGYDEAKTKPPVNDPFEMFLKDGFVNLPAMNSFGLGCSKALAKKHDEVSDILLAFYDGVEIHDTKISELEAKILKLEKQIEKLIGRSQND